MSVLLYGVGPIMVVTVAIGAEVAAIVKRPIFELIGRDAYLVGVMDCIVLEAMPALMQNSVKGLDITILKRRQSCAHQVIMGQKIFINIDASRSVFIISVTIRIHSFGHHN